MKSCTLVLLGTLLLSQSALAKNEFNKVIYGVDDRVEASELRDPVLMSMANATAVQIKNSKLSLDDKSELYTLTAKTLEREMNVCPTEKFANQPAAGFCSGFLVSPKLLVTAGHCVPSQFDCDTKSWVFDYRTDKLNKENTFKKSNVYKCKKIITQKLDHWTRQDYALIELDRPVLTRKPLKFRTSGKVKTGSTITVMGYPSGLPLKIASGAKVKGNTDTVFFDTDLDTFGGNSGSAVFNATTNVVEGILVRGAKDYVMTAEGCLAANKCKYGDLGCKGEGVTRITNLDIVKHSLYLQGKLLFGLLKSGNADSYLEKKEKYKTDVNLVDLKTGNTQLMVAMMQGLDNVVHSLIGTGKLDLNKKNKFGDTALHVAVKVGDLSYVKALVKAGANYRVKNAARKRPKTMARKTRKKEIWRYLRKVDKWYLFWKK